MKKTLLIILTGAFANTFAQIPNAGFEQTTTSAGFCNAGGGNIIAPTYYQSTPNTNATTTIAHSGSKAAMIATIGGQAEGLLTFDCIASTPYAPYTGFVPGSMTAWVRRAAVMSNDTLTITIASYDNAQNPLTAGQIVLTGAGYSAYTQVTIPLLPYGTGTPAKIEIAFTGCTVANSSWYVDDLAFQPVGIENYGKDNFNVFFSSGKIQVSSVKEENVTICIYDIVGKKMLETTSLQISNSDPATISTEGFTQGIYLVQVLDKTGMRSTKKILIQ